MFEKRVSKAVDQWDHTNAMGHGIVWIITFIPMLLAASAVGGWGWLAVPLLWMAILLFNWYRDSTLPISEYEERNGSWVGGHGISSDTQPINVAGYNVSPNEVLEQLGIELEYFRDIDDDEDCFMNQIEALHSLIEPAKGHLKLLLERRAAMPLDPDELDDDTEEWLELTDLIEAIEDGEANIAKAEDMVAKPMKAMATWKAENLG